jgi:hypothetical protein
MIPKLRRRRLLPSLACAEVSLGEPRRGQRALALGGSDSDPAHTGWLELLSLRQDLLRALAPRQIWRSDDRRLAGRHRKFERDQSSHLTWFNDIVRNGILARSLPGFARDRSSVLALVLHRTDQAHRRVVYGWFHCRVGLYGVGLAA